MEQSDVALRQGGWYINLGAGFRVDAEYNSPQQFWVALGEGLEQVNAWMKGFAFGTRRSGRDRKISP